MDDLAYDIPYRLPTGERDAPPTLDDLPGGVFLTRAHWRLREMDQHMLRQGTISVHDFIRISYNVGFRMPWLDPEARPKFN